MAKWLAHQMQWEFSKFEVGSLLAAVTFILAFMLNGRMRKSRSIALSQRADWAYLSIHDGIVTTLKSRSLVIPPQI